MTRALALLALLAAGLVHAEVAPTPGRLLGADAPTRGELIDGLHAQIAAVELQRPTYVMPIVLLALGVADLGIVGGIALGIGGWTGAFVGIVALFSSIPFVVGGLIFFVVIAVQQFAFDERIRELKAVEQRLREQPAPCIPTSSLPTPLELARF